jgi:hypothetical protein
MIDDLEGKDLEGSGRGLIKVVFQDFLGRTERN